jgi:segregation and condensation protein A
MLTEGHVGSLHAGAVTLVSERSGPHPQIEERPQPSEAPCAIVQGAPLLTLPKDLYIPPDALEVILEAFEGPLDLLLYLIRRQNLDILDIPVAEVTDQYMEYVEMLQGLRLELAADYLVMAAMLAEIKSRMLLPRPETGAAEEEDPRAELIRRLQQYERFQQAAMDLDALPRLERDLFVASAALGERTTPRVPPEVTLPELLLALREVSTRLAMYASHRVEKEALSLRERMSRVLASVVADRFTAFADLFDFGEGRAGVVVTFLAVLELIRESLIELVQTEPFAPIYVKAKVAMLDAGEAAEV